MNYAAYLREGMANWVHETVRSDAIDRERHAGFIQARVAGAFCMIAVTPPYLAAHGAPQLWETALFVCALLPLAGVFALSRTGNFVLAQAICVAGLLGAAAAICSGRGGLSAAGLTWLALAPMEAAFAFSAPLVLAATGATLATLVAIFLATGLGYIPEEVPGAMLGNFAFAAPAIVYAGMLAQGLLRLRRLRSGHEAIGAAHYDSLAGAMGDLVLRFDRSGAALFASPQSSSLFNVAPRELIGRSFFERVLVQDRPAFLKAVADAADRAESTRCELRLRVGATPRHDGGYEEPIFAWIELRARRISIPGRTAADPAGVVVLAVARDISREKRSEQEREAARLEAQRANAWKDRFLANVSHELRTPLNAIIGFSEMLGDDDLMPNDSNKRKEYADIIHDSGQHLLAVVNSILDMSKIEAGRFEIVTEAFDPLALIDMCCDMVSLKAEQGGVEIVRDYPARIEDLNADKRACKQVLINLLSNALKFTPRGGRVTVGARQEGAFVALFVSDTGVGINPVDLPRLGDAFFQAGASYDRAFEGTGLGLSVVRGLVGLHGGRIRVESGPSAGTCVSVFLPIDNRCAGDRHASARIEVIPRLGVALDNFSRPPAEMVKKIA